MSAVHLSLLLDTLRAAIAVAAAVGALVAVAALVEGRAPRVETLRAALPFAAYLGVAWALSRWRHEGGDVAVANAGRRPAGPLLSASLVGFALLAVAGAPPATPAPWQVQTTATQLRARTPHGPVRIDWGDGAARWDGVGTHPDLPRPAPGPRPEPRSTASIVALRWAALLALVAGLAAGRAPGLVRALGGAAAAFTLAHVLA